MEQKFSRELVIATIEFIRTAKEELGKEMGEEKVNAMLDAFDPALKGHVFMEVLIGNIGIISLQQTDFHTYKKIPVIRGVRNITGLGLKEAKEIVDNCANQKRVHIPGSFSAEEQRVLRDELRGTGFDLI